jgi:hypothetical protein
LKRFILIYYFEKMSYIHASFQHRASAFQASALARCCRLVPDLITAPHAFATLVALPHRPQGHQGILESAVCWETSKQSITRIIFAH